MMPKGNMMKYSDEICARAQKIIDSRRQNAKNVQLSHEDEVKRTAPEAEEIMKQIAGTSIRLSKLIIQHNGNFRAELEKIKNNNLDAQKMLANTLAKYHFPADYLDIKYTCSECEDTGFKEDGTRCGCFYEICSRLCTEDFNKSANMPLCDFEHFSLDYYSKSPDENGVVPYDKMRDMYFFCQNYAHNFSEHSESLLMIGNTGLGKTHLSLSIAKEVIKRGTNVIYGSIINLLSQAEKEHFGRSKGDTDTLEALTNADLIILDDLGSESQNSFYEMTLYNIINTRINLGKPVIISTNYSMNELSERYNDRILSRIIGTYRLLMFYGNDIRMRKYTGVQG